MIYRAIGIMSGSSLDGLDIAYCEFQENAGTWVYEIKQAACFDYSKDWIEKLKTAIALDALKYQLLHVDFGHYIGQQLNKFIEEHDLHYSIGLICSHGHTTFHVPSRKMTAQLGDGAAIASETQLPVITDLRAMDLAFGGQGAPIVPIGEKLLLGEHDFFLNLGGIANISFKTDPYIAFDICAANRVLNMLVANLGSEFDEGGKIAATGEVNQGLLQKLNALDYYRQPYPKSLANDFGTDTVYPIIADENIGTENALRTYVEHIAIQVKAAIQHGTDGNGETQRSMLVTGGGAFNDFLIGQLENQLRDLNVQIVIPDNKLVMFKEAMIMGFIGVLRWRQEYNVLSSVTGAVRDTIGGAVWIGQEA